MCPLEGNLSDNPEPLEEPIIRQILRELQRLNDRIRNLEDQVLVWDIDKDYWY
jgi:hypothetical protein